MNKPKVNIGYSQEIIDKCALLAPKEMCEYCSQENSDICNGSDHIYYDKVANKYYLIAEHYKDEIISIEAKYCLECGRKLIGVK